MQQDASQVGEWHECKGCRTGHAPSAGISLLPTWMPMASVLNTTGIRCTASGSKDAPQLAASMPTAWHACRDTADRRSCICRAEHGGVRERVCFGSGDRWRHQKWLKESSNTIAWLVGR